MSKRNKIETSKAVAILERVSYDDVLAFLSICPYADVEILHLNATSS